MYIRRKVFSVATDKYGDERLFSTTEIMDESDYLERLYAAPAKKPKLPAEGSVREAKMLAEQEINAAKAELAKAQSALASAVGKGSKDNVIKKLEQKVAECRAGVDRAVAAKKNIGSFTESLNRNINTLGKKTGRGIEGLGSRVGKYVAEHPYKSAGIASAVPLTAAGIYGGYKLLKKGRD